MDLGITRDTLVSEDRSWLASGHGFDDTQGCTLDGDLFPAADFPDGRVPSGTVIGYVGGDRKTAGPYDDAAVDGREDARGYLLTSLDGVTAGRTVSGAVLTTGTVNVNKLPANSGHDAAAEADLPRITHQDL